jgi:hypothetical protein
MYLVILEESEDEGRDDNERLRRECGVEEKNRLGLVETSYTLPFEHDEP